MRSILLLLPALIFGALLSAQPLEQISIGTKHRLFSQILQEERPYWVYLPVVYEEEEQPLGVLYLLDGSYHYHHASGILQFLIDEKVIPPLIMIAIPNTGDRTRDLTPPLRKDLELQATFPTAGGADKLLAFMERELIPEIEKQYRVTPYRILCGHSFGGLFSMYSLINRPDLFDAHLSISPSLWWDDFGLVDQVDSLLTHTDTLAVSYYMTLGNEDADMQDGIRGVATRFTGSTPERFTSQFEFMEKETHGTIPHRSIYNGLEAVVGSWYNADLSEIFLASSWAGIDEHFGLVSKRLGSPVALKEVDINELGYKLLEAQKVEEALEVFVENISRHPNSYNTYGSYAEALTKAGRKEEAINYYQQSLSIFPCSVKGQEQLAALGIDYQQEHHILELNRKAAARFEGTYHIELGFVAHIALEGEQLIISGKGIPREALLPIRENAFCIPSGNFMLTFTEEDGAVNGFEVQMRAGRRTSGTRLKTVD